MTDVPSLIDLEDHMDFGDEARRVGREKKLTAEGLMKCPTCDGEGDVTKGAITHTCFDCDDGWMTRMQQNLYFGEGGVNDAAEDQAYLERQEEQAQADEQDRLDEEEYGEAQAELEEEL